MDRIKETVKALQSVNSSTLPAQISDNTISVYGIGSISQECISVNTMRIKYAFPSLPIEFYKLLQERLIANGFTDERLNDAVKHVIDNCIYPTPTIATFISYDKRVKLLTYQDYLAKANEYGTELSKHFKSVRICKEQKKPMWAHVTDIEMYKLELWNNE